MEKPESGAQLQYELELLVYIPFRGSGSSGKLSKYVFYVASGYNAPIRKLGTKVVKKSQTTAKALDFL